MDSYDRRRTSEPGYSLADSARMIAQWGGRVLPLWSAVTGSCRCPLGPECKSPGKHPIAALVSHGVQDATSDPAVVARWWTAYPSANIGLAAGLDSGPGIVIVDVDPRNAGDSSIRLLVQEHGRLPKTVTAETGGGGWHLFFRLHRGRRTRGKIAQGVDVKAANGYVVAPPSVHASGRRYAWMRRRSPWEIPVAQLPPWLAELIYSSEEWGSTDLVRDSGCQPTNVVERAKRYVEKCEPAISGSGGHTATFRVAQVLIRKFELSEAQALEILRRQYNPRCQPPWSQRELVHKIRQAANRGRMPVGGLGDARGSAGDR
jgi:hypothetical protein